ncbi:MAG TPA: HAD family phosphatase [Anaerolineales bacterium]|nr:HAD family phosphatase [Anaerolineales bacterium]
MPLRAIFFDLGGVILRTEYQAPREHLAERLNTTYEDLSRIVFESETSRRASIGEMTTEAHWEAVTRRLGQPVSEARTIRDEFYAGDILDADLLDFIRSLRPRYKTGVISNAWPDLRPYLMQSKADDAFDALIISAEVGVMKPKPEIYRLALDKVGVTAAESVFVDDTAVNVEAARELGMRGIVFKEPMRALHDLKALMK